MVFLPYLWHQCRVIGSFAKLKARMDGSMMINAYHLMRPIIRSPRATPTDLLLCRVKQGLFRLLLLVVAIFR